MAAMTATLACGAHCLSFCAGPTPSIILQANGYVVTSFSSTCADVALSGSTIAGTLLAQSQTCHIDATLNDGEHFSLDVPFTNHTTACCCGSGCFEGYAAVWQPIVLDAPYTPDASPFPPVDASDAATDASDATSD